MEQGMKYNLAQGVNMGKIASHGWPSVARHTRMCAPRATAAVLSASFAFLVAAPLQLTAQSTARDSGDYNNSFHLIQNRG
jgi:hypothetical protein